MKGEREARERSIANTQRIRDLNRAAEAAFEEGVELAEMGSQPAPSPDVAQAREGALVRAEQERLQRAFPLVPTASVTQVTPIHLQRAKMFMAGDHLLRPGQVIEDPSTGQPATNPAAQRPGEGKEEPLSLTVRDDELQPLTEEGKSYLDFMVKDHIANYGGKPMLEIVYDGYVKEAQVDEALWLREGPGLEAAYTLFDANNQLEDGKKRLDKAQREVEFVSALDQPFSNLDPDSALAKAGALRHQQAIDGAKEELDAAQADYDFLGLVQAKIKADVEASDARVTPAHMKYVEDRKPLPESFLYFLPLGNVATNSLRAARDPKSDGGRTITEDEAKTIRRQRVGDVVAQLGTGSTIIGGPGLVFNAGKGILRGGAISKPLLGKILKEAPTEALEEAGFQTSDILFYRQQFDLPGFAGEVAVESFLQGAATFAPGRRRSGGAGADSNTGPPELTGEQLTALLSATPTGQKALAAVNEGSSTGRVMFTEDASGGIIEGEFRYVEDLELAGGETARLSQPTAQAMATLTRPALPSGEVLSQQGEETYDQAIARPFFPAQSSEVEADTADPFLAVSTETAVDETAAQPFALGPIEGPAPPVLPAAHEEAGVFEQAAALEEQGADPRQTQDEVIPGGDPVFDQAAALEGGVAEPSPGSPAALQPADGGGFVFDEAAALEEQGADPRQTQDEVIPGGDPVFETSAALLTGEAGGSRILAFEEAEVVEEGAATTFRESIVQEDAASDPGAALAPLTPEGKGDDALAPDSDPGTALAPLTPEGKSDDAVALDQPRPVTDAGAGEGPPLRGFLGRVMGVGSGADAGAGVGIDAGAGPGVASAQAGAGLDGAVDTTGRGQPDVEGSLDQTAAAKGDGTKIQTTGEDPEVVVEEVVVEKEVVKEVPVDREVVVEKEVVKEVPVDREVIVEKEVVKEVPVDREVIVEKEVVKEVPVDREVVVEKEAVVQKEAETAAAANEKKDARGRRRYDLPDIPDLTGLVPASRPARPLPYSGPGYPSKVKYTVTSDIATDLTSGDTTATLVHRTPIEIEGGTLTPSPNRVYMGRNITLITDAKGQADHLEHPERRYERTAADPSYLYTKSARKSNKPKNGQGRSRRGRGGHDVKMMGPPR